MTTPAVGERRRHEHGVGHVGEGNGERRPGEEHASGTFDGGDQRPADPAGIDIGESVGQGGSEDHLTTNHARQERALYGLRGERGQRHGAEDNRGPQRQRCHDTTLRLENDGRLDHPVSASTPGLRNAQAEEVGLGQLGP